MLYIGLQGSLNKYLNMVYLSTYLIFQYLCKEPQTPKYIMLEKYLKK
jgi:hypothetical protein